MGAQFGDIWGLSVKLPAVGLRSTTATLHVALGTKGRRRALKGNAMMVRVTHQREGDTNTIDSQYMSEMP